MKNLFTIISVIAFVLLPLGHFIALGAEADSVEKISLLAKPAVVRIGMQVTGTVRYPSVKLTEDEGGNVFAVPTGRVTEGTVTTGWTGSGFIINPTGYIITNAHVVDTSTETVSGYVWAQFSSELLGELLSIFPGASSLQQLQIQDLHEQILQFISERGEIDNLQYWLTVFDPNQSDGTIQDFIAKGWQVELKKVGQPFPQPGKDVAIIKVEKDNLVTVKLGESKEVKTGSRVFVVGYPSIADLNQAGYLEPSVTSGIVSAVKKSSQGDYNVIQIDAAISGGNSGGLVLDERGEVIGIATFGAVETQGFNWILPIGLAKEFLREINVENASGVADQRYQKGVSHFLAKRYSKAKEDLEAVQALYPTRAVAQLIARANEVIAKGEEKRGLPIPMSPTLLAGVGIGVLVLLGGGSYLLMRLRRKLAEALPKPAVIVQPNTVQPTTPATHGLPPTAVPAPPKPVDPRLSSHVVQSRSQGMSDEVIRNSLRQAGWPEDDINAALQS